MKKWYQINAKQDHAEILLYEEIGKNFFGEGISAKDFVSELQKLSAKNIDLRINSLGGNVFDGFAIHNALKSHKAKITVFIDGIAASIASVVAMSGDVVKMPENAMMMVHDPLSWALGTAADMRKTADALEKIKLGLVSSYRNKTGLDDMEISGMMVEETWLTAQEAVSKGFADVMLEPVQAQANLASLKKMGYKNIPYNLLNKFSARNFSTVVDKAPELSSEKNSLINDANRRFQTEKPQQASNLEENPLVKDALQRAEANLKNSEDG